MKLQCACGGNKFLLPPEAAKEVAFGSEAGRERFDPRMRQKYIDGERFVQRRLGLPFRDPQSRLLRELDAELAPSLGDLDAILGMAALSDSSEAERELTELLEQTLGMAPTSRRAKLLARLGCLHRKLDDTAAAKPSASELWSNVMARTDEIYECAARPTRSPAGCLSGGVASRRKARVARASFAPF